MSKRQFAPLSAIFSRKDKLAIVREELTNTDKIRRAFWDAGYLLIDFLPMIFKAHKSYGTFHRYLTKRRRGHAIKPEDFKDVDIEEMRKMLDLYSRTRGPLTGFDFRWFYWFYLVATLLIIQGFYASYQRKTSRPNIDDMSIEDRRKMFSRNYLEDVRDRK
jgi:hypothetical protein